MVEASKYSMLLYGEAVIWYLQITKGLIQKYGPERVRDTPITEVILPPPPPPPPLSYHLPASLLYHRVKKLEAICNFR